MATSRVASSHLATPDDSKRQRFVCTGQHPRPATSIKHHDGAQPLAPWGGVEQSMSGKVVGMVFDHYEGRGSELLLAVKLADNAHEDGTHIFPAVATLATRSKGSAR